MERGIGKAAALGALAACFALFVGAMSAWSYSASDFQFYDGLSDMSAFETSMSAGVALDPLNGLRLATDGTQTVSTWTSRSDFGGTGTVGPLVGQLTLESTGGAGAAGVLRLKTSPLALSFASSSSALAPAFAAGVDRADSYEVQGPGVVKVGPADYRMWYSGVAPDGYVQRIFEATSTDGFSWSRVTGTGTGGCVVDVGGEGAFDEHGLVRPTVTYDASSTPPYHMYYGTLSDEAGFIGSATSTDGLAWTKCEVSTDTPGPVLEPGLPGQLDGYSVGEPSVVYDPTNRVYHMWYAAGPGPSVGGRQVGYATSTDTSADAFGSVWHKGGIVTLPLTGNWSAGWFSPGVWLEPGPTPFRMIFAGTKGAQSYKLVKSNPTADPTSWQGNSIFLNGTGPWGSNNVYWASVLREGSGVYKVYYTGNGGTGDWARNAIGMLTWNGASNPSDYAGNPVMRSATPGTRFDANYTSNGSVVRGVDASGAPAWVMVYAGRAATDLQWRLGAALSTDLASWNKVAGTGDAARQAITSLGTGASFDASGALAPSVFSVDSTAGVIGVMYQARSAVGVSTFGLATTTASNLTSWSRYPSAVVPAAGATWDSADMAHPSVVRVGSEWRCYYAGNSGTAWGIGYATSPNLTSWTKQSLVMSASVGASETLETGGVYDPVVSYTPSASPAWRMWYTAKDAAGVERVLYATSSNGISWTRHGLAVCPSEDPYSFNEVGVRAAGSAYDTSTSTWHVFYTGIDRGNAGVSAGLPFTTNWQRIGGMRGAGAGYLAAGSGMWECVPTGTPAPGYQYEFKMFDWDSVVPTGTAVRTDISFYPAYTQPDGTPVDAWSKYFTLDDTSSVPYLPLTTQKVRWRVAFSRDALNTTQTPELQAFRIGWAPVSFAPTGTAVSIPISAAQGRYIDTWKTLNVTVDQSASSDSSVTASVVAVDGQALTSPTVLANGANSISLAALPPGLSAVRVKFDFAGDGDATSYIKNWSVDYTTTTRAPVSDFRGSGSTTSVALSWVEPDYVGFVKTRIVRRTDTFALSATDASAAVVYEASATPAAAMRATDMSASVQGQVYYYTAFTSDGTSWSPPAFAIGVPARGLTGLAAVPLGTGLRLTWTNGTTSTVPGSAWQGSRILRRVDSPVVSPTDASATVIARVKGAAYTDTSTVSGRTYRYGAWEHYRVTVAGKDYDAYSAGAATTATAVLTRTVTRLQGSDRYGVAITAAKAAFPGWVGVKHVVVACGEDRAAADPLAAAGLAGAYDAPILLVKSSGIPAGTLSALKGIAVVNHGVKIHIVGGVGSVPDALKTQMSRIAWVGGVDRVDGADRYAVTANIANRMALVLGGASKIPGAIIICSENPAAFYDALAASPAAYKMHMPMLGVRTGAVPPSVAAVLTKVIGSKKRYVASGATYISATTYAKVAGSQRLTLTTNRYVASSDIAKKSIANGWLTAGEVGLAAKLPDALTGGAFMGSRGGVLLFTDSTAVMQPSARTFITTYKPQITKGWIMGGTLSVTTAVETQFRNLLK